MIDKTQGVQYYVVYPDLTSVHHTYLMALKQDPRVKTAWSYEGHIKFTLIDTRHPKIFFVNDIRISPSAAIDNALKFLTKLVGSNSKLCSTDKDSISSKRRDTDSKHKPEPGKLFLL